MPDYSDSDSDSWDNSDTEEELENETPLEITFDVYQMEIDRLYHQIQNYTNQSITPFLQHNLSYYWFMKMCMENRISS